MKGRGTVERIVSGRSANYCRKSPQNPGVPPERGSAGDSLPQLISRPKPRRQWYFASEKRGRQTEGANLVISSLTFTTWELVA